MDHILEDFQSLQQRVIQLKENVESIVAKKDATIMDLKNYIKVS